MSVPAQRRTKSSKKKRASHFALKKVNFSACPKCKRPVLSHHACSFCGTYAGREVLKIKLKGKKTKKTEEKNKAKEEKKKNKK